MCRTLLIVFAVGLAAAALPAEAGNYGLDEYREALAGEHGPFVSLPTLVGATVGAVTLFPVSIVNGTLSLVVFRENPTRVAESWMKAPGRGWYWGGIVVGTPFRIVKGILWDAPAAVIRTFRRETVPKPAHVSEVVIARKAGYSSSIIWS